MTDQSEQIFNHIKTHPGTTVEGIVSGTGWNRHLVEVAVKLMVEQGLVREVGQTDWQDFRYETIERDTNPSPFQEAAMATLGFTTVTFSNPFSQQIADAIEQERLIVDIAAIAEVAPIRVQDFYQSHSFSLEYIKAAVQAGAKLDEEDIKRTMEERSIYINNWGPYPTSEKEKLREDMVKELIYCTFTVTLPNSDQRQVKAVYMKVDGATLYFEDEDHETILAFGPGHWVWAERVEGDNG